MSTERITRLQNLLERIKQNGALPRPASNWVFGGARAAQTDISTGPAVPAVSPGHPPAPAPRPTDVATPMAATRAVPIEPPPAAITDRHAPNLAGGTRIPTISGMASPVLEPEPADATPIDVIEELDIDEIDVVDITTEPPPEPSSDEAAQVVTVEPQGAPPAFSIPAVEVRDDELKWSEPPTQDKLPDSSPRPRIAASSLDEALAEAAEAESSEPLKTPPPESGRQPTDGIYAAVAPTPEQLGETVELEAPTSTELELDLKHAKPQQAKEELEFELPLPESALELPTREAAQTYTNEIARDPEQSQVRNVPEEIDTVETPALVLPHDAASPSSSHRERLAVSAELTTRKTGAAQVVPEFVFATRKFEPKSFAELLDASLMLVPKD